MDTKDKLIEKLKEYIKWLIKYIVFKTEIRPLRMSGFESEIAALDRQILDEGWKELENSGLDKPFIPSQVEEQELKVSDEEWTDEYIDKLSNLYLIANRMTYRTQKVRDAARESWRRGMKTMRDRHKTK